ncbi:DUF6251 family protein [Streptomyces sp. NPDC008139]|uniref:DUF6251 family protein n=1 Tax=Streptomyces sp. NPDC008139 TaxID=3364814 RepID=UPI0036E42BC9
MSLNPKPHHYTNPVPSFEPRPLPARRPETSVAGQATQVPQPYEQYAAPPQIVHIHEAAQPDRVLQRLALGAGVGAGATTAAVYYGPLLVASMEMVAITFLVGGLVIAVLAWSVVSVVGSLKPEPGGKRRR